MMMRLKISASHSWSLKTRKAKMPFQHQKRKTSLLSLYFLVFFRTIRWFEEKLLNLIPLSLFLWKYVLKQWRDPDKIKLWNDECSFLHFLFPFTISLSFPLLLSYAHIFSRRKEWSQRRCCICCCCPRGLCHHPVWCRLHRQRPDAESHCSRRSHSSDQHPERSRWLAPTWVQEQTRRFSNRK